MTGHIDECRGDEHYREFYRTGGWRYGSWKEYWWHRKHLIKRFNLRRGLDMLEVACGNGFHTNLFNRMGLRCVGVDRSESGIEWARRHYPRRVFHSCDFREMPFPQASFDVVLARGFSYYHYDLAGDESLDATRTLLSHVRPGGMFIMMIVTDLSGRRDPGRIWHNTIADYRRHFGSLGKRWSVDWVDGMAICSLHNAPATRCGRDQDAEPSSREALLPVT